MKDPVSAQNRIYRLVLDALFAALYVVLSTYLSIKIPGSVQISFSSLPILLCAFLLKPTDAVAVAVLGTFVEQVLDPSPYGYATLLMWLIPGAVQALIAGLGAVCVERMRVGSAKKAFAFLIVFIVSAEVSLTFLNTVALYIDGYIFSYPVKALHLLLPMRLLNLLVRTAISCVVVPLLLPPLRHVLRKNMKGSKTPSR